MNEDQVLERLGNLDRRVDRIEQFLPTLATRDEVYAAIDEATARLATKDELRAAIDEATARLATKDELREAVAKLATKDELAEAVARLATKDELREEGERSRRYMQMLFEDLRSEMRLWTESWSDVDRRDARQHAESLSLFGGLDRRVMALEAKGRRRRVQ
jgi:uncharacterized protein YdcH (DUF465 family)